MRYTTLERRNMDGSSHMDEVDDHMNSSKNVQSTGLSQASHAIPYGTFIPLPGTTTTLPSPMPSGEFISLPTLVTLDESENTGLSDITDPLLVDTEQQSHIPFEESLMQMLRTEISTPVVEVAMNIDQNGVHAATVVNLLDDDDVWHPSSAISDSVPQHDSAAVDSPTETSVDIDRQEARRRHAHDLAAQLQKRIEERKRRDSEIEVQKEKERMQKKKRQLEARQRAQQKKAQFHQIMAAANGEPQVASPRQFSLVSFAMSEASLEGPLSARQASVGKSADGDKIVKPKLGRKRRESAEARAKPAQMEEQHFFRDSEGRPRHLSLDEQHEFSLANYTHISSGVERDDSVSVASPGLEDAQKLNCSQVGDQEPGNGTPMVQDATSMERLTEEA